MLCECRLAEHFCNLKKLLKKIEKKMETFLGVGYIYIIEGKNYQQYANNSDLFIFAVKNYRKKEDRVC